MEATLDIAAIGQYAEAYTDALCKKFYKDDKETATGTEVATFSPVRQVNLFVVQEIFTKWQQEQGDIISPYFDYEAKAVKDAMAKLFTILSQNVAVEEGDLRPLVAKSTLETIILALAPEWYFSDYFGGGDDEGVAYKSAAEIKASFKYVETHQRLKQVILDEISRLSAAVHESELVDMILAYAKDDALLDNPDTLISQLNEVYPIKVEDLYLKPEGEQQSVETPQDLEDDFDFTMEEAGLIEEIGGIEMDAVLDAAEPIDESPLDHPFLNEEEQRYEADLALSQGFEEEIENFDSPAMEPVEEPIVPPAVDRVSAEDVVEQASHQQDVLASDWQDEPNPDPSLPQVVADEYPADLLQDPSDLPDAQEGFMTLIPAEKRDEFVAELFGGDYEVFGEACNVIDNSQDYHEGIAAVRERYFDRYHWDLTGDATIEFLNYFDGYFS